VDALDVDYYYVHVGIEDVFAVVVLGIAEDYDDRFCVLCV